MTKTDIVKNLFEAIVFNRFDVAASYLADDFICISGNLGTFDKKEWLDMNKNLKQGFPDLKFNLHDFDESGDEVKVKAHLMGTNSEDLPPMASGMSITQATGIEVENPDEYALFVVKEDQIKLMEAEDMPNVGITGMLKQLGIRMPD